MKTVSTAMTVTLVFGMLTPCISMISHPGSVIIIFTYWMLPVHAVRDRLWSTADNANFPQLRVEIISPMLASTLVIGGFAYTAPAMETAVRDAGLKYPLLNLTQTFIVDSRFRTCLEWETGCDDAVAGYYYSANRKSINQPDLSALIFPGCSEVVGINALAAQWDVLMITSATSNPLQRNKLISPTWITTATNSKTTCIKLYINLVNKFNWTSVSIIADSSSNVFFPAFAKDVQRALSSGKKFQIDFVTIPGTLNFDYEVVLKRVNETSRVYLYFGHSTPLRNLLIAARIMHMTYGEHVYIAMMPFRHVSYGNFSWNFGDSFDQEAKEAFRSLIIIEPDDSVYGQGNGPGDLVAEWKLRSQRRYNYTYGPTEKVSPHPTASYAAVMIFAEVINELYMKSLSSNQRFNFSSGKSIARRFPSRTFTAATGEVSIDDAGERIPDLTLKHLDFKSAEFKVVMVQSADIGDQIVEVGTMEWPATWPPPNQPRCGFRGDDVVCMTARNDTIAIATSVVAAFLLLLIKVLVSFARKTVQSSLGQSWWKLEESRLYNIAQPLKRNRSIQIQKSEHKPDQQNIYAGYEKGPATYNDQTVWLKIVVRNSISSPIEQIAANKSAVVYLSQLRESVHTNIILFLGLCFQAESLYYVSSFCSRGSLKDLLGSMSLINLELQISLLEDLLRGVTFIHNSRLQIHGYLSTSKCLIDSRFTLNIGALGYRQLRERISGHSILYKTSKTENSVFIAPEVLKDGLLRSRASDVYSVGIILNQITAADFHEFVNESKDTFTNFTPSGKNNVLPTGPLIINCCNSDPNARPSIRNVMKEFELLTGADIEKRQNVVEKILNRLATYTDDLDNQVAQRTIALLDERQKCDTLLKEMLPSSIVEMLRNGIFAEPEVFDSVTILFSEIGGFQRLSNSVSPSKILTFLNSVYSVFDEVIPKFDVYKVETVKDSYMVASGLPIRNGDIHTKEICFLSFSFLRAYKPFVSSTSTCLRIGVHSGPCAAGVIGHAVPRYCLFGDTVNTASRMLLHGGDSKIHLSETTAKLISAVLGSSLSDRGSVEVKGKGTMHTFWLLPDQGD